MKNRISMGFITLGNEQLFYKQMGKGPRLALAFHGYGDDCTTFNMFEEHLSHEYTLLSFDLPHHGKSKWTTDKQLRKSELALLVNTLKEKFNVNKVALLGYSLGGRICANIIALMPASIDKVVLIAPDGLRYNRYYTFFVRNRTGRNLFRHMMEHPENYFRIIDLLMDMKLIDQSRYKFVMHSMGLEAGRKRLLQIWTCLRDIVTSPTKIKAAINKHHLPITIYMGTKDKIMPPALARQFQKGTATVNIFTLDKGHRIIDHENVAAMARHLL